MEEISYSFDPELLRSAELYMLLPTLVGAMLRSATLKFLTPYTFRELDKK
jgi:hypothetical protein